MDEGSSQARPSLRDLLELLGEVFHNKPGHHTKEVNELLFKVRHPNKNYAFNTFLPSDTEDPISFEPIGRYYFQCNGPVPHIFNVSTIQDNIKNNCCRGLHCAMDRENRIDGKMYRNITKYVDMIDMYFEEKKYMAAARVCEKVGRLFFLELKMRCESDIEEEGKEKEKEKKHRGAKIKEQEEQEELRVIMMTSLAFFNKGAKLCELEGDLVKATIIAYQVVDICGIVDCFYLSEVTSDYIKTLRYG